MQISSTQMAMLTIQLSTLGQTDLRGNDPDALQTLEFLLEQAIENVRGALPRSNPDYAPTPDADF